MRQADRRTPDLTRMLDEFNLDCAAFMLDLDDHHRIIRAGAVEPELPLSRERITG